MSRDRLIRTALWASALLNALGVLVFTLPAVGLSSPLLPISAPPYFAAQMAFTIALFGAVYAWLARQPIISRPIVIIGGLGKLGFFVLTLVYVFAGELPVIMAISAAPDLVFALVFFWWARATGS